MHTLEQGLSGAYSLFHSVDWSRERMVDSSDMPNITTRITQALGPGLPHAQMQPRALADHMAQVAPVCATAETFHEYAVNLLRGAGEPVGFVGPGAFDQIASQAIALLAGRPADLDVLVLDEVQDLQADWVQALLGRVRQSGRAYLLEDPYQQLYKDREGFDLQEAITVS
jgi:hypothetical protein